MPAVGVAATDEVRGDGDRQMVRAVAVLIVVIKAASPTVTTVHTAATAAVPANMATVIRYQR